MPRNHIRRTLSEIQLEQDERVAEWREGQMYHRILTGMLRRSQEVGYHPKTNISAKNIIQTKASGFNDNASSSSLSDDESEWHFYESYDSQGDKNLSSVCNSDHVGLSAAMLESTRGGTLGSKGTLVHSCPSLREGIMSMEADPQDEDLIFEFDL